MKSSIPVLVLLATAATLVGFQAVKVWRRAPPPVVTVQRFPSPVATPPDATVETVVQRSKWTEYGDYGTIRVGGTERPARLLTGRSQWVREVAVPAGGARYEAVIAAFGAAATVRLARVGSAQFETSVAVDSWTRVALSLDARAGHRQSVAIDVDVPPGGIAAWGSELVTVSRRDDSAPDVILISLDTVRRDQLTPYNSLLPTTPSLAAFAREALMFDQAISTSSWTVASHATLFTGRFPADSLGYESRVEPGEYTLPEIFAANGYKTFGVSGGPYTDPRWGLHQGFDEYAASGPRENAREATSRAIEWISSHGSVPVFLFLNYFNAHEPLDLSPEVQKATGVMQGVPRLMWADLDQGLRRITPGNRSRLLRAYGAELTAIDHELRRLFEYLRHDGRWARTLVIVWSDHGQLLGERGHVGHAYTLDEELIRVPLIIKAPQGSGLTPGVYRPLFQTDDLFGLSQALAGLPNRVGNEMVTQLNAKTRIRPLAFSKIHHDPLPALMAHRRWRSATQWAVHDGQVKVIRDLEGRVFVYDVSGEEERPVPMNGANSPLLMALERFRLWSARPKSARTVGPLSPAEIERLRALGYLR